MMLSSLHSQFIYVRDYTLDQTELLRSFIQDSCPYNFASPFIYGCQFFTEKTVAFKNIIDKPVQVIGGHPLVKRVCELAFSIFNGIRQWKVSVESHYNYLDSKAIVVLSGLSIVLVSLVAIAALNYRKKEYSHLDKV